MKKTFFIIIATVFLFSCAPFKNMYAIKATPAECATADFGEYPTNYQQMIMTYMSQRLIDPNSAIYYFGEPEKAKAGDKYGYWIKVNINAKNRLGGYVGAKPYAFMIHNNQIWECMW